MGKAEVKVDRTVVLWRDVRVCVSSHVYLTWMASHVIQDTEK